MTPSQEPSIRRMEVSLHSRRFWPRQEIENNQLARLRSLIRTLALLNPFYRERIRSAGFEQEVPNLGVFRERFAFTLKEEIEQDQKLHPPYGSNLTYPLEHYIRLCQTSGTTRSPLRWLDTRDSWSWMLDCWSQVLERSGIGPTDRLFFAFSFAAFLGFWTAFDAASRSGSLCIPGGGLSSAARLAMMRENGVTGLLCTPTYALRLGEVTRAQELNAADIPLRSILVAGEPGGSVRGVREQIQTLWPHAGLIDHHGMTEIGPVSYQCPARPGRLHVLESDYIAEVVQPDGCDPGLPGQLGELVLTNLGRPGSPLIRYRTGDLVRVSDDGPCACGSWELALQGGILARLDDMVVIRGINVYPSAVDDVFRSCRNVAEYCVHIDTGSALPKLKITVEPGRDCRDPVALAAEIESELQRTFSLRIPVAAVTRGSLPRFEMKAQRWIRK